MVDMVLHRHELKGTIARLARLFTKAPRPEAAAVDVPPTEAAA
jgi:acetyl-CoA carboxylase carboxyl transferase subunit beta